jgi:hypothetical protein
VADPATRMKEEQIRSTLNAYGISGVRDLKQDGDTYVAAAEWHGKAVDLRFNAKTGRIEAPRHLDANQVEHMLQGKGYTNVHDVMRKGDTFIAAAEQRERPYVLTIDAQRGAILQQQAR